MNERIQWINGDAYFNGLPYNSQYVQATNIVRHTVKHGGGTFDVTSNPEGNAPSVPVDGYAVGGAMDSVVIPFQSTSFSSGHWADAVRAVARFIARIPLDGNAQKKHFLGTWVSDGKLYIDATDILQDEEEALSLAHKRGELAIYDGREDRDIVVQDWLDHIEREAAWAEEKAAERFALDHEDVRVPAWEAWTDPYDGYGYN